MEANGAVKASLLTHETTQVISVAQDGKPRAKTGPNTQTNSTSDHQAGKSGKASKGFKLWKTLNTAQWHVFQLKLTALGAFRNHQRR
jgi:hypothetical protein